MELKDSTIEDIVNAERDMFLSAADDYKEYFANASNFNSLLNNFIESINEDRYIFAIFVSQMKKHSLLALLSIVRRHHVQALMNIRQVLEAGSNAAYAIANTNKNDFVDIDENGILDASQDLAKKRNKWLEKNFEFGSNAILNHKKLINSTAAHSNLIYAHTNSKFDEKTGDLNTPFFDFKDDYIIKTDLWYLGNIIMGLLDLFFGVNQKFDGLKFKSDFVHRLKKLESDNIKMKDEMMKNPRFKKFD